MERITVNPDVFAGKPIVRGKRIAVEHILGMMVDGATEVEIVDAYPFLEADDIRACLMYAWQTVSHERIELLPQASAP
jgi:uncharacterized protein (DUF433 family)